MDLVSDASVLIGELLRERGRRLISNPRNRFYLSAHGLSEVQHELPRRVAERERRRQNAPGADPGALPRAFLIVDQYIRVLPAEFYADFEAVALRRVPRDPRDWPTVALALALEAGIWTADADFFGCGVPTWTTETLFLDAQA